MSDTTDRWRRWGEVEALFIEALERPPDARAAFLATVEDEQVRSEVRSLLACHVPEHGLITSAIGRVADEWAASGDAAGGGNAVIGRRFGAYEVTALLGQGGMGAVYRARRADGHFEQDAAIKLVRFGFDTPPAMERFLQERRILARLTHPAIARLLDGGTAIDETGRETPYLVMEYVDGEPITRHCAEHRLSIADRVALFRLVCDAVQHAHQQFIVHRDLKPTNILVTRDRQPKLLDFGIAKLLTEDVERAAASTSTGLLLTPDYASPEQVTGGPVTAASDIYALGVLLYELLTGEKAQRFQSLSPLEIARVVCDTQPIRPSLAVAADTPGAARIRRQLEGDLDTILLKALQKEPERRYRSVEQFSEDLRRHLDGVPVIARADTIGYRAAKFVRRNRWPVAGGTLIAASLIAGTIVSTWQARRAERRFDQVRSLAHSLIYDVHDEIRELPGSTRVQQKIVTTGLDYLNRLAAEAGGDAGLQRDLAAAYVRIADVQGGPLASNLGDVKGALESYRKARELYDRMPGADRTRDVAGVDVKIGEALSYHGDLPGALAAYTRAQSTLEPVAGAPGARAEDLEQLSNVFEGLARVEGLARDMTKSLESSERVLKIRRSLAERDPANHARLDMLAESEAEVSMALQRMGNPRDALPHAQQSLAYREQRAAEQPNNVAAQRSLILSYSHVADVLGNPTMPSLGDAAGATDLYRKMTAVAERLAAADQFDERAKWDLSNCLLRLGSALVASPARDEGIGRLEQAAALLREMAAAEPANNRVRINEAFVYRRLGDALADGSRADDAIDRYGRAIEGANAVLASDPAEGSAVTVLVTAHIGRGMALARAGRHDAAAADGRQAIDAAERAQRTQSGNTRAAVSVAAASAALGRIELLRGTPDGRTRGCVALEHSLQLYRRLRQQTTLDAQTAGDADAVARDAARCR
jgi:serine/threonine protein kinase